MARYRTPLGLEGLQFRFAYDDAAAQLAGTRTKFFGYENSAAAAEAMLTWPGLVNYEAIDLLNEVRAEDNGIPAAAPSGEKAGVYDCATDTCSNGKQLPAWSRMTRKLACALGRSDDSVCSELPAEGELMRSDGAGSGVGGDVPPYVQATIKRLAFIILAIVLIYAAVRSLNAS